MHTGYAVLAATRNSCLALSLELGQVHCVAAGIARSTHVLFLPRPHRRTTQLSQLTFQLAAMRRTLLSLLSLVAAAVGTPHNDTVQPHD